MIWTDSERPTRAVNVSAALRDVEVICAKKNVVISAIEELPDGGTHVVLMTMADADKVRLIFKDKLLGRNVRRTRFGARSSGSSAASMVGKWPTQPE